MFDWLLSSLLGALILFYISQMLRACKRIYKRFRLPVHIVVAGSFDPDGSLGSGLRDAQSSDSARLEAMRRNKKWHEWPRRQYLYLRVFLEEFVGISSVVSEKRYRKQASKGERAYNVSITNILRNLEYKARQEVSSTGARDAHGSSADSNRAARARWRYLRRRVRFPAAAGRASGRLRTRARSGLRTPAEWRVASCEADVGRIPRVTAWRSARTTRQSSPLVRWLPWRPVSILSLAPFHRLRARRAQARAPFRSRGACDTGPHEGHHQRDLSLH
jgi:hypothetical protein